jgi:hypothetical protein
MHCLFIIHHSKIRLDTPKIPIQLYNTVRIFCVNCPPILCMFIINLVNGTGVFQKRFQFLIAIILWVLFDVQRFRFAEFIDKRKFAPDLISIADEFSGKFFDKKKNALNLGSVITHLLQELKNEFLGKNVIDMHISFVIG